MELFMEVERGTCENFERTVVPYIHTLPHLSSLFVESKCFCPKVYCIQTLIHYSPFHIHFFLGNDSSLNIQLALHVKINTTVSTLPDKLKAAIERVELTAEFIIHSFEYIVLRLLKLGQVFFLVKIHLLSIFWNFCRIGRNAICNSTIMPQVLTVFFYKRLDKVSMCY